MFRFTRSVCIAGSVIPQLMIDLKSADLGYILQDHPASFEIILLVPDGKVACENELPVFLGLGFNDIAFPRTETLQDLFNLMPILWGMTIYDRLTDDLKGVWKNSLIFLYVVAHFVVLVNEGHIHGQVCEVGAQKDVARPTKMVKHNYPGQ